MADLSKIKLNGTEYNLKDTEARQLVSDLEDSMPEIPTGLSGFDNDMGYIITETDPTVPAWAKAANKPTYTAQEVGALPSNTVIPTVPTDVSAFTNDAGYLTSYTETDPTVPAWAKAANKPTYTAAEVGALPDTTVIPDISGKVNKSGDTMTGDLEFINWRGIKFTSGEYNVYLKATGFTLTQAKLGFTQPTLLQNIATPSANTDAVNKEYVDNQTALIKTTAANSNTEYNLLGTATTNNNTSAVNIYNQDLLSFAKTTDLSRLTIGSTATPGVVRIYTSASSGSGFTDIKSNASSTNERTITLPDASGTVALTTDIPDVPAWALASSKPSYTFSELTSHPTTLGTYGITDAYTKTEVDGLVSGVLHYKGTKSTTASLPSSGNTTGDVWHVSADGSEWAWDGSEWQELGTATDLSGYVPTSRTVNGKALTTDITLNANDVNALAATAAYVSTFNGESGAITYTAPVTSVNGNTGAVTLSIPALPGDVGAASASHAHGSITNDGAITSNTTIGTSDKLVFVDNSDSNKLKRSSISFGSSTSQFLANNGTWQNIPTSLPASDVSDWAKASSKPSYTASEVGAASATHAHGDITSGGDITTTATIASGDRIIINDESASKVTNSSITFGSSTAQYLANNGTWQNVPAAYDDTALAARVTALEQIPWVTYYTGSTTPSNAQGNNGDLYFQTSQ